MLNFKKTNKPVAVVVVEVLVVVLVVVVEVEVEVLVVDVDVEIFGQKFIMLPELMLFELVINSVRISFADNAP